jgi:hypothetical protein
VADVVLKALILAGGGDPSVQAGQVRHRALQEVLPCAAAGHAAAGAAQEAAAAGQTLPNIQQVGYMCTFLSPSDKSSRFQVLVLNVSHSSI